MSNSVEDKQKQTGSEPAAGRTSAADRPDAAGQTVETQITEKEHGGSKGPEPTRHGDWEHNGRCTDF